MRAVGFASLVFAAVCGMTALGQAGGRETAPVNTSPADHFSADYGEARRKFLDAAGDAGARIESLRHPRTDPDGEPLYTDVAFLGPKQARQVMMLVSGTHGIEGFAGSAIQTGLLREGITARLAPDQAVVMVHAINPYGFAHLRRVNEDNVDVNRNFVDHALPYPDNPGYEKLARALAPRRLSFFTNLASNLRFLWFRVVEGQERLKCAITAGQYTHPDGLFYGGDGETWSNRTIRKVVRDYLAHTQYVAIVGVHTGLGPFAEAEIILNEPKASPAYRRAVAWWGEARTRTTVTGEAVSCHLSGPLKLAYAGMLPEADVTAVSLEFGTLPDREVFAAVRADNWLNHYGGENDAAAREIKARMMRAFYPDSETWKRRVWSQGKEITAQVLTGLRQP